MTRPVGMPVMTVKCIVMAEREPRTGSGKNYVRMPLNVSDNTVINSAVSWLKV